MQSIIFSDKKIKFFWNDERTWELDFTENKVSSIDVTQNGSKIIICIGPSNDVYDNIASTEVNIIPLFIRVLRDLCGKNSVVLTTNIASYNSIAPNETCRRTRKCYVPDDTIDYSICCTKRVDGKSQFVSSGWDIVYKDLENNEEYYPGCTIIKPDGIKFCQGPCIKKYIDDYSIRYKGGLIELKKPNQTVKTNGYDTTPVLKVVRHLTLAEAMCEFHAKTIEEKKFASDQKEVEKSIIQNPSLFKFVKNLTEEICELGVFCEPENIFWVPFHLRNQRLYDLAFSKDKNLFFRLPNEYKTVEMCARIVRDFETTSLSKNIWTFIPGNLISDTRTKVNEESKNEQKTIEKKLSDTNKHIGHVHNALRREIDELSEAKIDIYTKLDSYFSKNNIELEKKLSDINEKYDDIQREIETIKEKMEIMRKENIKAVVDLENMMFKIEERIMDKINDI